MKDIMLSVQRRSDTGKGAARQARREGRIPAVVYGPETDPMMVSVEEAVLRAALRQGGHSALYTLNVDGAESKVVLREVQRDPVTSRITHIDFHAVSMNKPINVSVPLHFVGIAPGVKTGGGIMQTTMREIEISCLPANIPEYIEVNVEQLEIGDAIHVSEIRVENAEILTEPGRTAVVISAPTVIKSAAVAEGEEAAAAVAAEGAEGAEGEEKEGDEKKDEKKKDEK